MADSDDDDIDEDIEEAEETRRTARTTPRINLKDSPHSPRSHDRHHGDNHVTWSSSHVTPGSGHEVKHGKEAEKHLTFSTHTEKSKVSEKEEHTPISTKRDTAKPDKSKDDDTMTKTGHKSNLKQEHKQGDMSPTDSKGMHGPSKDSSKHNTDDKDKTGGKDRKWDEDRKKPGYTSGDWKDKEDVKGKDQGTKGKDSEVKELEEKRKGDGMKGKGPAVKEKEPDVKKEVTRKGGRKDEPEEFVSSSVLDEIFKTSARSEKSIHFTDEQKTSKPPQEKHAVETPKTPADTPRKSILDKIFGSGGKSKDKETPRKDATKDDKGSEGKPTPRDSKGKDGSQTDNSTQPATPKKGEPSPQPAPRKDMPKPEVKKTKRKVV